MTRTDADKQKIIQRLTLAARPSSTGELYIRASKACRIIGVGDGQRTKWEVTGKINPVRFRVPPGRGAPIGVLVAWPLGQVIECARRYKPMSERRWTEADEDRLLSWLGRVRVEVIAKKLSRTVSAVNRRAWGLGVNARTNAGKLTPGLIAVICRRSRQAVQCWCLNRGRHGLAFRRLPGDRRVKLIDPEDLCAFLKSSPTIWNGLPEASRRMIERMAKPVVTSSPSIRKVRVPRIYRRSAA